MKMDSARENRVRSVLAAVCGALVLSALSCSPKARVEFVDWKATTYYQSHKYDPWPEVTWYWQEMCSGRVTNKGDKTAFEVRVKVYFKTEGRVVLDMAWALIDKVNLEPGEVGSFTIFSDTFTKHTSSEWIIPESPFVSESVAVSWE